MGDVSLKKICIYLIRAYQVTPLHAHSMCRFTPTCSEYTIEAIEEYGVIKGIKMGIKRILRCRPHGGFGFDPVVRKENNIK